MNPTPSITSLTPASVTAGRAAFALTVTGTGFVSGATATVGGHARTATVVSATRLTVAVQANDVVGQDTVPVKVTSPAACVDNICRSNTVTLRVTAQGPTPVLPPTPVPTPAANRLPTAYLDAVSATGVVGGWAADPDRPTQALQVAVVVDGADVATVAANQPRPDVTAVFPQFTGNHGVVYTLPAKFQDGLAHQLRLFAIDDNGSRVEFNGSNRPVTLTPIPSPSPTPIPGPQPPTPAGTWAQLPNTSVYPAQPFEAKGESAPGGQPELWSPQSLFAYSGADVAQRNGGWGFLIWGGGHAATPDNSLYWVPFDGSGATRLTGPYLAPDKVYLYDDPLETYRSVSRNAFPTVTVAAAPKSRHTYSSLLRIDVNGRPAVFNYGGSLRVGSGSGTAATRVFDLSQPTPRRWPGPIWAGRSRPRRPDPRSRRRAGGTRCRSAW